MPDALPDDARHLDEVLARAREADAAIAAATLGAVHAGEADPYRKPHEEDHLDDEADVLDARGDEDA